MSSWPDTQLTLVDVLEMKEMPMLIFAAVFGQSPVSVQVCLHLVSQ